jgi:hypothetical protein
MEVDPPWARLGQVGTVWRLLEFDESQPPTWESYWADQRKYWGADKQDRNRVELYFGKEQTEENLLRKAKDGYEKFCEYLHLWNGLCALGDELSVIPQQPNVIVLTKDWKGEIADHSDLEVWLKQQRDFLVFRKRFCCEIYSFGTLVIPEGSIEAQMGEKPGTQRISHRKGKERDKNETITLIPAQNRIQVSDALFQIVQ